MTARRLCALLALSLLAAAPAAADNKAEAVALFDRGISEAKAGRFAQACEAFAASNALVPDSGTRGSLARCYGKLGRLASAWVLWRELADTAPTPALRADAASQARALQPRLARYAVAALPAHPGLVVTLAGKPLRASVGVEVPVDAGSYPLEARAPGFVAYRGELVARDGEVARIEIPALAPEPTAAPVPAVDPRPGPSTAAPVTAAQPSPPPPPPPPVPGRGRRIAGLALGGAGVAGVVVGGVFGLRARGRYADAEDLCGGAIDRCPGSQLGAAQDAVDRARSAATIATIATIAGAAAVTAGVVLYVTAPRARLEVAPQVSADGAGVVVGGRF